MASAPAVLRIVLLYVQLGFLCGYIGATPKKQGRLHAMVQRIELINYTLQFFWAIIQSVPALL